MGYISASPLQREQNKLKLNLISYTLDEEWQSSQLINELREKVIPRLPIGLFDPQDLEHQVLFRLTTYDPEEITEKLIDETIEEQLSIIEDRLSGLKDRAYLFRGLDKRNKDLNIEKRLELKNNGGELYATGYGRTLEVEFKKITDLSVVELFTQNLHYIHSSRHKGDAFGFYFKGDDLPWGVETTEYSYDIKKYKRDALLAHGINPEKAVEITRLYLLPGCPKNAISILDGLVARYYKDKGMEAMYTTTMPMYAKTKGATIAGGMKDVLLVKDQRHSFRRKELNGRDVFIHDVTASNNHGVLKTHPKFPTLLTVETYMRLNRNKEIKPLDVLSDKVIYINPISRRGEKETELRFEVTDLSKTLKDIQKLSPEVDGTSYISDSFWGYGRAEKMRLREIISGAETTYEASCHYRVSHQSHIRTLVNDILYRGKSRDNAISAIKIANRSYKKENSCEKIRMSYRLSNTIILIDIYPFGAFLKLIGSDRAIIEIASSLGYGLDDGMDMHTDDLYLKWSKDHKPKEMWDVRFGLIGDGK